jgi:hypothetical protein
MENWLNINYSGENIIIEVFIYFIISEAFSASLQQNVRQVEDESQ